MTLRRKMTFQILAMIVGLLLVSGAGLWGQLDLAGNVWEWTLDSGLPYSSPCSDCAGFGDTPDESISPDREIRGGSFGFSMASPALREDSSILAGLPVFVEGGPTYISATRSYNFGFRCARAP